MILRRQWAAFAAVGLLCACGPQLSNSAATPPEGYEFGACGLTVEGSYGTSAIRSVHEFLAGVQEPGNRIQSCDQ